jgi:hypothetical protein
MKIKLPSLNYVLLVLVFFTNKILIFAQPGGPGGGAPGGPGGQPSGVPAGTTATGQPCFGPTCVPIDGGTIFLILAGITLGVFMIYSRKNKIRG